MAQKCTSAPMSRMWFMVTMFHMISVYITSGRTIILDPNLEAVVHWLSNNWIRGFECLSSKALAPFSLYIWHHLLLVVC